MINRLIKIFILLSFLPLCVYSQILSVKTYTSDEGLPQNSVYSVLQDKQGYIRVATEDGTARFDGVNFSEDRGAGGGPVNSDVRVIFQDSSGVFWMGTIKGLSRYDGKSYTNYTSEDGLPNDYIQSICQDKNGDIWLATRRGGIVRYTDTGFVPLDLTPFTGQEEIETYCGADSEGNLWVSVLGNGVVKYDGNKTEHFTTEDGLVTDTVFCIDSDRNGNVLFGGITSFSRYDGENFKNYFIDYDFPYASRIMFILEDTERNFWIGTDGNGLFSFDGRNYTHYSDENGLPSNLVQDGIEDLRGDLWFGTRNGGLVQIPAEKFLIYNEKTGLADNIVYGLYKDDGGNLWFGHEGSGMTRLNPDGEYEYFTSGNGIKINSVPGITGAYGVLWFSSFENGIMTWNGSRFRNYTADDGLVSNVIISMREDSEGDIWFGGEGGVSVYSHQMNKMITDTNTSEITGPGWIWHIYEDNEGFLWFGTEDRGVLKFNKHRFINGYTTEDGLASNLVFYTEQDKFGNYWFGTDAGLTMFDGEEFKTFTEEDGLGSNTCYFIADHANYLYIGTAGGLTRFDYLNYRENGTESFKTYTVKDGLAATECNTASIFKDKNGIIYFGTQKGVTVFNPANKPKKEPSPLYVRNIRVEDDNSISDTLTKPGLEFDYTENDITFNYICLDYTSPDKVIYKYKLDGSDNRWTQTGDHSVTYKSLPPNEYRFRLIARNADGIWSETETTVPFVITPPFWQTWWFYTISGLFMLSLIYFFYTLKTRQVKKRNLELAQIVKKRTRELENEKDKSEALLLNILPTVLVEELKNKGNVKPREFKNVSILFTDFEGFTYTASVLPAEELVKELNELFKGFDKIIEKFGLEKLKTIGDSYMAAGGLPMENSDHAVTTIYAAMDMHSLVKKRNENSPIKWNMRAGIHSGQVIAGVVGTKKFTYDVWGDTVNIASRMESSGEPGEINISAYTYMLVRDHFECEYRGKVDAKGKGKIDMYFVKGIRK